MGIEPFIEHLVIAIPSRRGPWRTGGFVFRLLRCGGGLAGGRGGFLLGQSGFFAIKPSFFAFEIGFLPCQFVLLDLQAEGGFTNFQFVNFLDQGGLIGGGQAGWVIRLGGGVRSRCGGAGDGRGAIATGDEHSGGGQKRSEK